MRASWSWPVAGTILSDLSNIPAGWQANPLLQSAKALPGFLRQDWDTVPNRAFGVWRVTERPDPMAGQTESLPLIAQEMDAAPDQPTEPVPVDSSESNPVESPPVYSEAELQARLHAAREEGRLAGHDAALEQAAQDLSGLRLTLQHAAQALEDMRTDPRHWLKPLQKLSVHIAQELVRAELRIDAAVIERLIQACIDLLEPGHDPVVVQVNPDDLLKIQETVLPGVILEADETLSSGSVRVKRGDSQVEDLIEDRLTHLCRQILEDKT